ncbi:MAG: hypothetical protein ACE5I1_04220 [bacterium]
MPNAPAISQSTSHIIFDNDHATYKILKENALSDGLILRSTGENIEAKPHPFALYITSDTAPLEANLSTVSVNPLRYIPTSNRSGTIEIEYTSGVKIIIGCEAESSHFLFELLEVDTANAELDGNIATILLAYLQIKGTGYGEYIGAVHNGKNVVTELALNMATHIFSNRPGTVDEQYNLWSQSFSNLDLMANKVALLVCPAGQWLTRVENIENQYGLPHRTIGGVWDKKHPDIKRSYFFVDITEKNSSDMITYARRGWFKHIMPYVSTWAKTYSSYGINPVHYPRGLAGLKEVVRQVHVRGLKFGFHTLSFMINVNDPLITPTPDARLAKESPCELLCDISAADKEIAVSPIGEQTPLELEKTYQQHFAAREMNIIIENEIITCSRFVDKLSNEDLVAGFIVVQRGAFGTARASHDAGKKIHHLPEFFDVFLADLESDLPDEIASGFAATFNDAEGDFLYLDGSDGMRRVVPKPTRNYWWEEGAWYGSAITASKFAQYLQRDALLQSSSVHRNSNYSWHLHSRGASGDFAAIGVEAHIDHIRIKAFRDARFHNSFFPQELGWIGFLAKVSSRGRTTYNDSFASTSIDEIEYCMNRALGFDLPISLEAQEDELKANGMSDEIFRLIGAYEKLRLVKYFPASTLAKLQRPDDAFREKYQLAREDYHLVRRFGRYGLQRRAFFERVATSNDSWDFENPFHNQPLMVQITALPGHTDFDDPKNIELLDDRGGPITFDTITQSGKVECTADDGKITAIYPVQAPGVREFGWCSLTKNFAKPLDLSRHKTIGVEAIGDGKDEVVVVQLTDNRGFHRQHQFVVDFQDGVNARRLLFPLPSAGEQFKYPDFFENVMALRFFDYSKVSKLTIHLRAIPQSDDGVTVTLGSIKALQQDFPLLGNPSLTIGSRTVSFPTVLSPREKSLHAEPWDYVKLEGNRYNKFDGNHNVYQSDGGIPDGQVPIVKSGRNTITYRHEGANRALVRIVMVGRPKYAGGILPWPRRRRK